MLPGLSSPLDETLSHSPFPFDLSFWWSVRGTDARTHACFHTRARAHTRTHKHVRTHAHTHTHTYIHTYIRMEIRKQKTSVQINMSSLFPPVTILAVCYLVCSCSSVPVLVAIYTQIRLFPWGKLRRAHSVCFLDKNLFELHLNTYSRRKRQRTLSGFNNGGIRGNMSCDM